ncbi:MAG: hypothetical protein IT368_13445 [Candidatus Hydrogenedentes bacterium]|nr:hypothetical protein [Candidatus Hydrogenedentota bacterium]
MVIYMEQRDKENAPDESMILSEDQRSLVRGRRRAPRTPVCRPCLIWRKDRPDHKHECVALDLNRYGLRIQMFEEIGAGLEVVIQLMRDDDFQMPLGTPVSGRVVRAKELEDGISEHGVEVLAPDYRRPQSKPVPLRQPGLGQQRTGRMYTVDITIGDRDIRRYGRRRGQ